MPRNRPLDEHQTARSSMGPWLSMKRAPCSLADPTRTPESAGNRRIFYLRRNFHRPTKKARMIGTGRPSATRGARRVELGAKRHTMIVGEPRCRYHLDLSARHSLLRSVSRVSSQLWVTPHGAIPEPARFHRVRSRNAWTSEKVSAYIIEQVDITRRVPTA